MDADLVLVHGFWSSPATWDRLIPRLRDDPDLAGLRIHAFGYESPKLHWPVSSVRIPDYNDIAQSLPAYLAIHAPGPTSIAIVTHSQGGLILQRFLAWMLTEGRGRELARFRLAVMLSCPNEGSEYLRSIRAVVGFWRHPQASQLDVLDHEVREARRVVLRQVVNATTIDDRNCPIPVYVYSGRTDNIVRRESAQSVFPNAEVLPGDHFSILDPDTPGHLTVPILKRHLLNTLTPRSRTSHPSTTRRSASSAIADDAINSFVNRRGDRPSRAGEVGEGNQAQILGVSALPQGVEFHSRASLLIQQYENFEEAPSLPPRISEDSVLRWRLKLTTWVQAAEKLLSDAINLAEDRDSKEYPSVELAQNIENAQAGLQWVSGQIDHSKALPENDLFISTSRSLIEDISKVVAFAVGS